MFKFWNFLFLDEVTTLNTNIETEWEIIESARPFFPVSFQSSFIWKNNFFSLSYVFFPFSIGLCIILSNHTLILVPIEMTLAWLFFYRCCRQDKSTSKQKHEFQNRLRDSRINGMEEKIDPEQQTQNGIEGSLMGSWWKKDLINIKLRWSNHLLLIPFKIKNIIIIVNFITHHISSTFFSSVTSTKDTQKEP